MKRVEDEGKKEMPELNVNKPKGRGKLTIYRKGTIGDWKNVFTEEQRREFDAYIEREEKKGLAYRFTFE
ncbi:unnamed protein product [Lymnaea stagnalis]|uniref:Sulfotransferase domain-containing protein n=1 Tax=Lymnaea stagnalis TaxID=6523 RepID=A0AAV2IMG9_LYMST